MDADTKEYVNPNLTRPRQLMYWRKHPNLQGWMQQLWESRGRPGADDDSDTQFNGVELELEWRDIEQLESVIKEAKSHSVSHLKTLVDRRFSYGQLQWIKAHLKIK